MFRTILILLLLVLHFLFNLPYIAMPDQPGFYVFSTVVIFRY